MKGGAIAAPEPCLAIMVSAMLLHLQKMPVPVIAVFSGNKIDETATDQFPALLPQQRGAGEVNLADQAIAGEGQITDGSEVIKIHIAVTGFLQGGLRLPQGLVLYFQFDLMHAQFMQQLPGRTRRYLRKRGTGEPRLGFGAQQVGLVWFIAQNVSSQNANS